MVIKRNITEAIINPHLINRISPLSKKMLICIAKIYNKTNKTEFDVNDFRNFPGYNGWRKTLDVIYELESRGLGVVNNQNGNISIEMFAKVLNSIKI